MKKGKYLNEVVLIVAMVFGCLIGAQASIAATYPDHPIKQIVGFTPGGPASTLSVTISKRVSEFLEQPINVEHKPGANGIMAATSVAKSKPDGYTLFTASDSPLLLAPLITPDVTYALDDFIPIVGYGNAPTFISIKKGRWNSFKEFIEDAKKNPGKYSYSTQGANSFLHLVTKILWAQMGIDLKMIPLPGTAEAVAAVLGGHIDVSICGGTGGLYEAGRLDVLAIAEKKRLEGYPKIPTLGELGYPVYFNAFYYLAAPKGTPQEIITKLYDAHQKAYAKYGDELGAIINKFEMVPAFPGNPAYLSAAEIIDQNNSRRDAFRKITKDMGILVPNR